MSRLRMTEAEYEALKARLEARGVRQQGNVYHLPQPPQVDPKGKGRKAGWREIAGRRVYFRSAWEANWSRYLEWLRCRGEVQAWDFEPHTFWFDGIRRGVVSYLPDFRVVNRDHSIEWHEIKGFFDARSKTKLKRMAKYYPDQKVVLIGPVQYNSIASRIGRAIEGWE